MELITYFLLFSVSKITNLKKKKRKGKKHEIKGQDRIKLRKKRKDKGRRMKKRREEERKSKERKKK